MNVVTVAGMLAACPLVAGPVVVHVLAWLERRRRA